MDLKEFFQHHQKAALGFSGGVDSSYLLYPAKSCGADIGAYFIKVRFSQNSSWRMREPWPAN